MRVVLAKVSGIAAYLAFVGGLAAVCAELSRHVATHALTLAQPHFTVATSAQPLTLVERRRLEASVVKDANPPPAAKLVPPAPAISLAVLAAQMDVSEKADLVAVLPLARRTARARNRARPERLAAADVFGRSFGVMLVVSR